jgi:hypothetical protein
LYFPRLIHIPKCQGNCKILTLPQIHIISTSPVIPNYHEIVDSFSCFCHGLCVTYLLVRLIPRYYATCCLTIMLYYTNCVQNGATIDRTDK